MPEGSVFPMAAFGTLRPEEALEEHMSYLAASPSSESFFKSIATSPNIGLHKNNTIIFIKKQTYVRIFYRLSGTGNFYYK
jgi:hypothetical protein